MSAGPFSWQNCKTGRFRGPLTSEQIAAEERGLDKGLGGGVFPHRPENADDS